MPIHTPDGVVAPEWRELDRQLRDGDGLNFSGDPRLSLGIGVVEERLHGRPTGRRGMRLEVWRFCEDGTDQLLGSWNPAERYRVLFDLARMRAAGEGRSDSVLSDIDKANAAKEAVESAKFRDAVGEQLDHALRLDHDLNNPKNTFRQVGGFRDETKAKARVSE